VAEARLIIAGKGTEITAYQAPYVELMDLAYLAFVLWLARCRWRDELSEELV